MNNRPFDQGQAGPLALSRFQRPRFGSDVVARPRLYALLNELRSLTLISAPDGYGKTVLVSKWLETLDLPHAWLTLDASHSDPNVFAAYFLAAVRKLAPDVGADAQALRVSSVTVSSLIADYLIAEMHGIARTMVLVLDNYHDIEGNAVHDLVEKLVRELPRAIRLVIITRRDPPFSLTNLRAYGLLTEVRTNALRFTPAETTAYLQRTLGGPTNEEVFDLLQTKAEGWIAGLHLMALHLQSQPDDRATIRTLQNVDRFATEYLAVEVLRRQPPIVQEFLIKTSILDALHAPLCAATVGAMSGSEAAVHLAYLCTNNLFTYEEGSLPGWYRYQHLFRQVLREQLRLQLTHAAIADLHVRASAWYAAEGMVDNALVHAGAAGDRTIALNLVVEQRHTLMNREEWHTLRRLLDMFDHATIRRHPDLLLSLAWIYLTEGRMAECAPLLAQVDELLGQAAADQAGEDEVRTCTQWQTEADILRTELLFVAMRPQEAIALGHGALAKATPAWQTAGSHLIFSLAGAYQMTGDLTQAYAVLNAALEQPHNYPSIFHVRVLAAQCMIQWIAADLPAMLHTAVHMRTLAEQLRLAEMRSWAHYFAGSIYYHWGELERAEQVLKPVVRQPSPVSAIAYANASCVLAAIHQARGNAADANAVTAAALDFLSSTGSRMLSTVQAFAAELALKQGDLKTATQWAVRTGRQFAPAPGFYWLAPELTRPKVLLALNHGAARQEAAQLLTEARDFYNTIHNTRFLIETLVLLTSLYSAEDNAAAALDALEQAIRLAQPGGLTRLFVDAGPHLIPLLETLIARNTLATFAGQLCTAITQAHHAAPRPHRQVLEPPRGAAPEQQKQMVAANVRGALVEPLTSRELDVLQLMAQRITNREIAHALDISTHTVKQHIGNVLSKLQVTDRRQAIARARDLGILPSNAHFH